MNACETCCSIPRVRGIKIFWRRVLLLTLLLGVSIEQLLTIETSYESCRAKIVDFYLEWALLEPVSVDDVLVFVCKAGKLTTLIGGIMCQGFAYLLGATENERADSEVQERSSLYRSALPWRPTQKHHEGYSTLCKEK